MARSAAGKALHEELQSKLEESGVLDQLSQQLHARLVDCGWKESIKNRCRELIKAKGVSKVTVVDLVQEVTPAGRASVPQAIKAELLQQVKAAIESAQQPKGEPRS